MFFHCLCSWWYIKKTFAYQKLQRFTFMFSSSSFIILVLILKYAIHFYFYFLVCVCVCVCVCIISKIFSLLLFLQANCIIIILRFSAREKFYCKICSDTVLYWKTVHFPRFPQGVNCRNCHTDFFLFFNIFIGV